MAIFKFVSSPKTDISSLRRAISYVSRGEKTDEKLMSGILISPEKAFSMMKKTKEFWGKKEGRQYYHFVQSFAGDEKITPEKALEIAKKFAESEPIFSGHEILLATHKDKKHIHTHFIINSVSLETGKKIQMNKHDLERMKKRQNEICVENFLSPAPKKGYKFSGEKRKKIVVNDRALFEKIKQAEAGETQSYVYDIAIAYLTTVEKITSRDEFFLSMNKKGYEVTWTPNRKHITFTDQKRAEAGEKKKSVRLQKLAEIFRMGEFSKAHILSQITKNQIKKEPEKKTMSLAEKNLRAMRERKGELFEEKKEAPESRPMSLAERNLRALRERKAREHNRFLEREKD